MVSFVIPVLPHLSKIILASTFNDIDSRHGYDLNVCLCG